jgi:hypothetical protein
MGTDICLCIEELVDDNRDANVNGKDDGKDGGKEEGKVGEKKSGVWRFVKRVDADRAYGIFAVLAGVRNYIGVTPIAGRRGIPADVSAEVIVKYRKAVDTFAPSWLYLSEVHPDLNQAYWSQRLERDRYVSLTAFLNAQECGKEIDTDHDERYDRDASEYDKYTVVKEDGVPTAVDLYDECMYDKILVHLNAKKLGSTYKELTAMYENWFALFDHLLDINKQANKLRLVFWFDC